MLLDMYLPADLGSGFSRCKSKAVSRRQGIDQRSIVPQRVWPTSGYIEVHIDIVPENILSPTTRALVAAGLTHPGATADSKGYKEAVT